MSKHLLAVGVLCGALLTTSQAQAQTAYQNFPLDEGNMWVFATDSEGYLVGDTQTHTIKVTREWYMGRRWFANLLEGLYSPNSRVIMYDHLWSSTMWVHDGSAWSTAFRFAAAIGDIWNVHANECDSFDVQPYDTAGATISVPAGDFTNTRGFNFKQRPDPKALCAGPTLVSLLTEPGIGPVAFSTTEYKGHLLYARVQDRVVAAAPHSVRTLDGLETTLLVADDELVHMQIVCITAPCIGPAAQLNFAFVVRNVSDETVELNFNDAQAFEVDLWVGNENARRYSQGHLFSPRAWTLTLAPGESHVLSGNMPLSSWDNSIPLTGEIQLVGFLMNTEGAPKLDVPVVGRY